jgi:hypothetical protein
VSNPDRGHGAFFVIYDDMDKDVVLHAGLFVDDLIDVFNAPRR